MKKNYIIVGGFVLTFFSVTLLFSDKLAPSEQKTTHVKRVDRVEAIKKFSTVLNAVEKYYVDDVNANELIDKALEGMLSNLDAHSNFMNKEKYKELQVHTDGEFGGLGITVGMKDGALSVISPIEGTPADKVGIKAGDFILKIDQKSTIGMTIDEAVGLMRGAPDTKITLTLVRKGEEKPLIVEVVRAIIKVDSVYAKKIDGNVLYMRVTSFDRHIVDDLKKEIKKATWATGFILDLRNNPGGLLDQAVGLVDIVVDSGVIVSQKGKIDSENRVYNATVGGDTQTPLVVLINGGSASASEIVSGALQDHKRGVVIGENSFGKGSVQMILPIDNDEALKLTIARYFLPSGRTIQATGVVPDIEVFPGEVSIATDEFSIKEKDLKKHLTNELAKVDEKAQVTKEDTEDKTVITKEKLYKDAQLKTAVDILKVLMITKGVAK